MEAISDYIAMGVADGRPVIYLDYGSGSIELTVNKIVNDGSWHKLEVSKVDRVRQLLTDPQPVCVSASY